MNTTSHRRPRAVRASAVLLGAVALLAFGVAPAGAAPAHVGVTGYDILDTPVSGFGGWAHTYTGTITPDGLADPVQGTARADYTGGSGTLNDGVVDPTSISEQFSVGEITVEGRPAPTTGDTSVFPDDPHDTIVAGFDATRIAVGSRTSRRTGPENSLKSCSRVTDANHDGRLHLRCQFSARAGVQ